MSEGELVFTTAAFIVWCIAGYVMAKEWCRVNFAKVLRDAKRQEHFESMGIDTSTYEATIPTWKYALVFALGGPAFWIWVFLLPPRRD